MFNPTTTEAPSISTNLNYGVELDLVQVTNRAGKKIMIQRSTAQAIEESWQAINDLTQNMMLQQEAFQKQNQDVDTINDSMKRNVRLQKDGWSITVSRGIDGVIKGILLVFFFFKTQLVAAAILFQALPSICATKYENIPSSVKGLSKIIALISAAIIVGGILCKM